MVKLKVLSNIEHDKKPYKPGETLGVDEAVAEALVAAGAAELIADAKPQKDAK